MKLDIKDFNLEKADEMKISGVFNGWIGDSEPIHHIEGTLYEIELALSEGTYEYKYLIDNEWYPKNENLKLIIGENGALFPQGDIGTGKFIFEAIDRKTNLKTTFFSKFSKQIPYFIFLLYLCQYIWEFFP